MGYKTKIDWCDSSWNPVTGCKHDCKYCYARGIANRYGGYSLGADGTHVNYISDDGTYELNEPLLKTDGAGRTRRAPYPFRFAPTLHRYRLDQPSKWSEPRTIFVCSMADLFGGWVPDEWIQEVFRACEAAPQHRYLFLTKNPKRFKELRRNGINLPKDCWIGTSVTNDEQEANQYTGRTRFISDNWDAIVNWFVSVEPILERMSRSSVENLTAMHWVIVGAETGRRKDKVVPKKEWIDEIAAECKRCRVPIFMKESIRDLMGDDFRQDFPWEVNSCEH